MTRHHRNGEEDTKRFFDRRTIDATSGLSRAYAMYFCNTFFFT